MAWLFLLLAVVTNADARKGQPPPAPDGFEPMVVKAVVPMPGGAVVVLANTGEKRLIQVSVGQTEGLTIALRHARRAFERPLTHDLLDEMLVRTGAQVVQVRIDALVQETFVARVSVQVSRRKVHALDARASDAIALAVGHDLPVYVASKVIKDAGVDPAELRPKKPDEPDPDDPTEAL